jgi:hypothetical protein
MVRRYHTTTFHGELTPAIPNNLTSVIVRMNAGRSLFSTSSSAAFLGAMEVIGLEEGFALMVGGRRGLS